MRLSHRTRVRVREMLSAIEGVQMQLWGFVGHRGACPRSGRLKSRVTAPERTLARLCREAGAHPREIS